MKEGEPADDDPSLFSLEWVDQARSKVWNALSCITDPCKRFSDYVEDKWGISNTTQKCIASAAIAGLVATAYIGGSCLTSNAKLWDELSEISDEVRRTNMTLAGVSQDAASTAENAKASVTIGRDLQAGYGVLLHVMGDTEVEVGKLRSEAASHLSFFNEKLLDHDQEVRKLQTMVSGASDFLSKNSEKVFTIPVPILEQAVDEIGRIVPQTVEKVSPPSVDPSAGWGDGLRTSFNCVARSLSSLYKRAEPE